LGSSIVAAGVTAPVAVAIPQPRLAELSLVAALHLRVGATPGAATALRVVGTTASAAYSIITAAAATCATLVAAVPLPPAERNRLAVQLLAAVATRLRLADVDATATSATICFAAMVAAADAAIAAMAVVAVA
jgi:hypothetical protein